MSKHSYIATFKRKDETVFTKTFLASDLFEADEYALEYATKRDILYLDLGPAVQQKGKLRILYVAFLKGLYGLLVFIACQKLVLWWILIEGIKPEIVDKKEIKC